MLTTQDLIEMAVLDAHGLLDDTEQAEFESAFRASAPATQSLIRREQTRHSDLGSVLPDVEPPAELRAQVISAVRAAIAEDLVSGSAPASLGMRIEDRRRVSSFWRFGAIGALAASVALGIMNIELRNTIQEIDSNASNLAFIANEDLEPISRSMKYDDGVVRITFSAEDDTQGHAAAFVHKNGWPSAPELGLVVDHNSLEARDFQPMTLVLEDRDGNVIATISEITTATNRIMSNIELMDFQNPGDLRLAIRTDDEENRLILASDFGFIANI